MQRNKKRQSDLSIIIPAAGMGRRMKAHGPKSMIPLNSCDTVLSRQISILNSIYPYAEIILVLGYESDYIYRSIPKGIKVVENELYDKTNVLRSIGMGMKVISSRSILIVYGDLVFNRETINSIPTNHSTILFDTREQFKQEEVGVTIIKGKIYSFGYESKDKWAQIVYLTGQELEIFKHAAWDREKANWYGFEGLNYILHNGGKLKGIEPTNMKIVEIDTSQDINRARKIV